MFALTWANSSSLNLLRVIPSCWGSLPNAATSSSTTWISTSFQSEATRDTSTSNKSDSKLGPKKGLRLRWQSSYHPSNKTIKLQVSSKYSSKIPNLSACLFMWTAKSQRSSAWRICSKLTRKPLWLRSQQRRTKFVCPRFLSKTYPIPTLQWKFRLSPIKISPRDLMT